MELFDYSGSIIDPKKGDLLLSEPFLPDPNFARTVILLCEHNDEGSIGFVLNKPADVHLGELLDNAESRTTASLSVDLYNKMLCSSFIRMQT
jgi:putative transcriptional regulator